MAAIQPWLDGIYKLALNRKCFGVAFVEGEDVTLEGPMIHEDLVDKGLDKRVWKKGIYDETDQTINGSTRKVKILCPVNPEDEKRFI